MGKITPRSASVVIYQGDDQARLRELRAEAERATRAANETAKGGAARIGDDEDSEAKEARDRYDAFVDEAAERAVLVEFHHIGKRRFRDLMGEHPPRKVTVTVEGAEGPIEREVVHEDDDPFDVNTETFPDALLTYVDVDEPEIRTIVEPTFNGRKEVQAFLDDELAEGDYETVWTSAYWLNRLPSADPKAGRYSPVPLSSPET